MKRLLTCILGLFLVVLLTACSKKTYPFTEIDHSIEEKGVLKTTIETSFDGGSYGTRYEEFINEDNNVLFRYIYSYDKNQKNWKLYHTTTFTYNEDGLLIKEVSFTVGFEPEPIHYVYNYNGLIIDERKIGEEDDRYIYKEYDYYGNLVCEIEKKIETHKYEFEYDENNNQTKEIWYRKHNGDWEEQGRAYSTYDDKNREIRSEILHYYNDELSKGRLDEYFYDDEGRLSYSINYDPEDDKYVEAYKTKYKYDSKGNLIKETEYEYGYKWWSLSKCNECYKTKYKYDKQNNLISKSEYDSNIWVTNLESKTEYYYTYFD